jgi:hypothetical protein
MIADGSAPTRPLILSVALFRESRISKWMPGSGAKSAFLDQDHQHSSAFGHGVSAG